MWLTDSYDSSGSSGVYELTLELRLDTSTTGPVQLSGAGDGVLWAGLVHTGGLLVAGRPCAIAAAVAGLAAAGADDWYWATVGIYCCSCDIAACWACIWAAISCCCCCGILRWCCWRGLVVLSWACGGLVIVLDICVCGCSVGIGWPIISWLAVSWLAAGVTGGPCSWLSKNCCNCNCCCRLDFMWGLVLSWCVGSGSLAGCWVAGLICVGICVVSRPWGSAVAVAVDVGGRLKLVGNMVEPGAPSIRIPGNPAADKGFIIWVFNAPAPPYDTGKRNSGITYT